MINEIVQAERSNKADSPAHPRIVPEIEVRKEWLPKRSIFSVERVLLVAIVVLAIAQAVFTTA
jgi:hypothetical protein